MIVSRYDRTDTEPTNTAVATRTHIGTLQWDHDRGWWGLTTEFQKRDHEEDGSENSERTSTGAARIRANPTDDLNVYLEHQNTFSGTRNNQTTLGTEYQVQSGLALQASGTTGTSGQSAQGGMVLTIDEKRLYLTERVDQSKAGRSTSTVLGAETPLDPSSKIYTEYQWEHTDDQDRSLSLTGIQKRWKAAPGITLELAGEYSDIDSGPEQTSRYTVATGLSYEHPSGIKISTRNELREETGQSELRQYLTVNGLEIKLTPDFTFMGKYRFSETQDKDLDEIQAKFTELNVGLAYRPIAHDRFNALARYSQLTDQRPINLAETESSRTTMDVFSLESSLDIHPSVEWVEKVAYRIQKEKTVDGLSQTTRTYLSINRLNFQMWRRFYLGMEYRILFQKEADDKRQGWLMELMWEATKNLRLGIGYNFTDFSDNEFSDNDYSVQGGFFRIQGKY
jgi:hypothetical protein